GALLISPYYNKPTQEGLYRHFRRISEEVNIPIMLYNIQSRTAVNIEPETIARLVKDCPNIVAIKEASGNLEQMARIKMLAPRLEILSGDDALTLPLLAIGGAGVVSVLANIAPRPVVEMINCFMKNDLAGAQEIYYQYLPLVKILFLETNPIPVKTAAGLMGLCQPDLRLPLCAMSEKNQQTLRNALQEYQLIK
ncbi:MAG: 4-hydroxy-tetrahydrodipicolinate synthase, partial [Candidatus Zixiibacteriota bacterium]